MDQVEPRIETPTQGQVDERTRVLAERIAGALIAAGVAVVGIREFSKRASRVIHDVEESEIPVVITRHGRPVATLLPPTTDQLVGYVLANATRFVQAMERTEQEAREGRLKSLDDLSRELARDATATRGPLRKPRRSANQAIRRAAAKSTAR